MPSTGRGGMIVTTITGHWHTIEYLLPTLAPHNQQAMPSDSF
jgi:hypothetical protein